jgi:hypothetical protein
MNEVYKKQILGALVEEVLEENSSKSLDSHKDREVVKVAIVDLVLEKCSLGSVDVDNDGQIIIYTGLNAENLKQLVY